MAAASGHFQYQHAPARKITVRARKQAAGSAGNRLLTRAVRCSSELGAFTGLVAGIRFLSKQRYDQRAALGLLIGGIPAVLLAAFAVKSLSLDAIRWLVMAVIVYTAVTMRRSASAERQRDISTFTAKEELPYSGLQMRATCQ
ncbi:MAG: TSUP family transporter [Blastocatellia bacterium]